MKQKHKTWKQANRIIHKSQNKDIITHIKTVKGFENEPHRRVN